ncbi:hypothetical protein AB0E63_45470 [Kribbella sp. NPDC026596]|uniref:hypothetical protein n=1 Tax=Kribbella sp. NPDC026596 TaxID=3155122 RepID=UPI0033E91CA7
MRGVVTGVGVLALIQGAAMFISPSTFLDLWPWTLSPLSCRTLAAVCCLGSAGVGIWNDARWSTLRQMLEVEIVMVGLILLAALRARDQLDSSKPARVADADRILAAVLRLDRRLVAPRAPLTGRAEASGTIG